MSDYIDTYQKPEFDIPVLPDDITDVTDGVLMDIFRQHVEWQNFLAVEVGNAELYETRAENTLRRVEAKFTSKAENDKLWKARGERDADEGYSAAKDAFTNAHARRKALQIVASNCERSANFVSRELSRRIGREPNNRRNDRWGGA